MLVPALRDRRGRSTSRSKQRYEETVTRGSVPKCAAEEPENGTIEGDRLEVAHTARQGFRGVRGPVASVEA